MVNGGPLLDPEVERLAREFVAVRVDTDDRPDLVRRWNVRVQPGLLCFDPDGGLLVEKTAAIRSGADVVALLSRALAARERKRAVEEAARKSPDDPRRVQALADSLYRQRLWARAADAYRRAGELDPEGLHDRGDRAREFLAYAEAQAGRWAAGLEAGKEFEKRHPDAPALPQVLFWRGVCLEGLGRRDEAREVWRAVAERFPEDSAAASAREALGRGE